MRAGGAVVTGDHPLELPKVSDAAAVERGRRALARRLAQLGGGEVRERVEAWLSSPHGQALSEAIFGGSPFLTQCLLAEPELVARIQERGLDRVWRELLDATEALPVEDRSELARRLRLLRRQVALLVALADLGGRWDLDRVTAALSAFAGLAVAKAVEHLLLEAAKRKELALADPAHPERESGLVVLAMGKLGAFELNYSSDIDLIVLFDEERFPYRGRESPMALAVRLARALVYLLEQKTREGYVFRTDLRLRPHLPGHPLAISVQAAELYYERHGQNWERAAFIKARPVAGDLEAGERFVELLRPYVWRKHLDFAAIRDIHAIKRQIHAHRGHGAIRVLGHDLKVGRGGIREIEFFVQTQQLILGGRHPVLRSPRTREALWRLAEGGWIAERAQADLDRAYVLLRCVEHRLQMVADRQTQKLPEHPREFARFAAFAGFDDAARFETVLREVLLTVERHYAALFEREPDLGLGRRLVFTGTEEDPGTLETLRALGFQKPEAISARIRAWHHGHIRATRSARARELLTELTPAILESLRRQPEVDRAFELFDQFLSGLPAGVQVFSLFHAHPRLLTLLADLTGAAPRLAGHLAAHPELFETMLAPDFFDPLPDGEALARELREELAEARGLEEVLDACRRWAHGRQFQAGLQVLLGRSDVRAAQSCLTAIAEVVIRELLPHAAKWLEQGHGRLFDGRFVVVGMGKLGSRELTIGSDLDLVFIYQAPEGARSDGPQPLAAPTYFARLAQRLISALTARTAKGRLFDIDMRLRPSGSAGPVACGLESFRAYHRSTAEIWEQQALCRARPVAGDARLAEEVVGIIDEVIRSPRDPLRLAREVRRMRERIFREHGSPCPWNLKHARGGLVEIEFTAQFLQLAHAHGHPELRTTSTRQTLEAAARAGLLAEPAASRLIEALDLHHALQAVLRLGGEAALRQRQASPGVREALLRAARRSCPDAAPVRDLEELERRLCALQEHARSVFDSLCPPDEA